MDKLKLFMKASRFQVIPVMMIPIILGALGAYAWKGIFHPLLFVITLIGAGAAHLFSNMINDLWDYRNGVDVAAAINSGTISTNSGFLTSGTLSEKTFAFLTWALFSVALICGLVLGFYAGWWVLIFGGLGGLIAYFYVAPPLKFGYRGKGYSELAILLSFGILPIMGSYFVQTMELDYRALLLSLPIGLLTTLILFNHHFLHWQSDKQAGKHTLVVVWGEQRAIQFSRFLLFLAFLSLLVCVIFNVLPYYSLIALVTVIPIYKVYGMLKSENPSVAYLPLMGASLRVTVRCGSIMILTLLAHGIFQ